MFFVMDAIGGINGIGFNGLTGVEGITLAVEVSGGIVVIGTNSTTEGQHVDVTGTSGVTLIMGTVDTYAMHISRQIVTAVYTKRNMVHSETSHHGAQAHVNAPYFHRQRGTAQTPAKFM